MLEYVHLRFFKPHTSLRVEFGPEATVLVGESDSGKTTVIQALGWVLCNKPAGDFTQWGAKEVSVTVGLDGHTITKTRRGNSTTYVLDKGEPFKGVDVPAKIAEIVNTSEINWQFQMDSPFWLSDGGTEISRQINSVVDMEAIDKCAARVSRDAREAVTLQTAARKRKEEADAVVASTPDPKPALCALDSLFELEAAHHKAQKGLTTFYEISARVVPMHTEVRAARRRLILFRRVVQAAQGWRERTDDLDTYNEHASRAVELFREVHGRKDYRGASKRLVRLVELRGAIRTAEETLAAYDAAAARMVPVRSARQSNLKRAAELRKQIKDAQAESKVCTECGRPLDA